MHRITTGLMAVLVAILITACASTPRSSTPARPEIVSIPEYREFLVELDSAIQDGEPRELNDREMERYSETTGKLNRLLAQYDSLDNMPEDHRRELFNLHEALQSTVVGRREDQILCRRTKTVGTNFRETRCMTHAQWEEEQRAAQDYFRGKFSSGINPADFQ